MEGDAHARVKGRIQGRVDPIAGIDLDARFPQGIAHRPFGGIELGPEAAILQDKRGRPVHHQAIHRWQALQRGIKRDGAPPYLDAVVCMDAQAHLGQRIGHGLGLSLVENAVSIGLHPKAHPQALSGQGPVVITAKSGHNHDQGQQEKTGQHGQPWWRTMRGLRLAVGQGRDVGHSVLSCYPCISCHCSAADCPAR